MILAVTDQNHAHQEETDQQSRNDACHEQTADGAADRYAVHNHHDAGRDDRAAGGRSDGNTDRFFRSVTFVYHGRDQQAADAGGIRLAGTGDAAEEHTGDDVCLGKGSRESSD